MLFLPPELALAVAETAALRYSHTSKRWVATLCLVCKAFRITVQPILYNSVVLGSSNWDKISLTADRTALFSHTRTLVVLPSLTLSLPKVPTSWTAIQGSHFPNVEDFTGWLPGVVSSDRWRLTTLSLAYGRPTGNHMHGSPPACLATLTHLHLSSETQGCYFDVSQCTALEYIVWDFCSQTSYMPDVYDAMLPGMCAALIEGPPALRRLLLRTFHLPTHVAPRVGEHVRKFAVEERIDRLWLDDSRVLLDGGDMQRFVDEEEGSLHPDVLDRLAVRDALRGRESGADWYLAGRQLYIRQDS